MLRTRPANPFINYALVKKFYADPALEFLVCYSTMLKTSENMHFAFVLITSRFSMFHTISTGL